MLDYNYDEETNPRINKESVEVLYETDTNLQKEVQLEEQREEPRSQPKEEIRVLIVTSNKNMINNHTTNQIIGSKEKGKMRINIVLREEICLISQVEPKSTYEATKDDFWIKDMK